ncbi:hypothetical protein GIB67_009486 [Kingdonia uniflora]|uniref:Poly A polymerase head domain-containing protein n=1 Tax=Kingdonia uniflora TaxID=39325 RepID=A0A7J7N3A5_9MAGN|nr:hypothetical protein GIB67_024283 [Kingdonia uniflora]KAF6161607.1 hypothetical protein GIB67_009486 [Kingdonia uniflora]
MAISGLGFTCRTHLPFHPRPYIYCVYKIRKRRRSYSQAFETLIEPPECVINNQVNEDVKRAPTEWKKFSAKELGISTSSISKPTREVLNELRKKRYEVYLVGGCVRDLILNRTPKDFDVITSAELREVRRIFPQCKIVGRRFPICHVDVNDTIIEVSSFSTSEQISSRGLSNFSAKQPGCSKSDYRRWMNCLKRDFTVNG